MVLADSSGTVLASLMRDNAAGKNLIIRPKSLHYTGSPDCTVVMRLPAQLISRVHRKIKCIDIDLCGTALRLVLLCY